MTFRRCTVRNAQCTMDVSLGVIDLIWKSESSTYIINPFNPVYKTMYLDSAKKVEIFSKYGQGATDTGSPEAQIALFSFRISHLTDHLRANHKDYATSRAMKMLVGKRRRMLDYLMKKDINRYRNIVKELGLRR